MVRDADSPAGTMKQAMRTQHLRQRKARSVADRKLAGEAIAAHAAAEPALARPQRVAIYLSMATEPPTDVWIAQMLAAGRTVIVPVIDGDDLDWVELNPEPSGPRLGANAVTSCDFVVVPALAADRLGSRLGRGGGYYDRALRTVTAPVTAIVFADELVDRVPLEPHDRPVQSVLTPQGFMRTNSPEVSAASSDRSNGEPPRR